MEEIKCEQVGMLSGGNLEPKIIEPIAYDEQNGYLRQDDCVGTLTTDGSSPKHNNRVVEPICLNSKVNGKQPSLTDRCYDINAISTCVTTSQFYMGNIVEKNYRIRKLTERECFRLMGVKNEDFEKVRYGKSLPNGSHKKIVNKTMNKSEWKNCWRIMRHEKQSMSSCYHFAGDSICASVLMSIFGEMLDIDYEKKIADLVGLFINNE